MTERSEVIGWLSRLIGQATTSRRPAKSTEVAA